MISHMQDRDVSSHLPIIPNHVGIYNVFVYGKMFHFNHALWEYSMILNDQ